MNQSINQSMSLALSAELEQDSPLLFEVPKLYLGLQGDT